jgi:hypothetical protein
MAKKCAYLHCIRVVSGRSKTGVCGPCQARYRYWDKQSAARRLERRRRLELSGETMAEFITDTKLKQHERKLHKREVRVNGT